MREPSTARAGALAGTWEIGDHLQLAGEGERYSADTPLRATFYGISADGGGGRVSYAWDSATIASAALRRSWFTDGNDRTEASAFFTTRLVERAGLSIDLRPELWWGANTRPDAPYFNPHRSASADVSAAARHLLWRRYERSLRHELRLTAGAFAQEDLPNPLDRLGLLRADPAADDGFGAVLRCSATRAACTTGAPVEDLRFWINLGHRFK